MKKPKDPASTASINAIADTLKRDRRTVKRAIMEAGLEPACIVGGHPRYSAAEVEDAVEEHLARNLPPWNPSQAEAVQRLSDLALRLLKRLERSNITDW